MYSFHSDLRTSLRAVVISMALAAFGGHVSVEAAERAPVKLDIEPQPLGDALAELARQSGLQVMLFAEVSKGLTSPRLVGVYSPEAALKILLTKTDLNFEYINERTVAIRGPRSKDRDAASLSPATTLRWAEASAQESPGAQRVAREAPDERETHAAKPAAEEEVMIVTGTKIRGAAPVGQQTDVITREEMMRAGVGSLKELGDLIPQNFGGGNAEPLVSTTLQAPASTVSSTSSSYTSSFNLRGLGAGSTLTLINGRRVAPAGAGGAFGINSIPINLVERVEIVPDGGSAVYGSDAVGGVINVITRRDFSGVEAHARYGSAEGLVQRQTSLLAGHGWNSGSGFLYAERAQDSELQTGERPFIGTDFLSPETTLVPRSKRTGIFASVTQNLAARLRAHADVLWSGDDYRFDFDPGLLNGSPGGVDIISRATHATVGIDYALTDAWTLGANIDRSTNDSTSHSDNVSLGAPTTIFRNDSSTLELSASGPLMQLPSGAVQSAFGSLVREEKYRRDPGGTSRLDRKVFSAYGELLIPVARKLKVSLAGRWDDYSGSESRLTPKFGFSWQPAETLTVRGSYARAFRAPSLPQTDPRYTMNFWSTFWFDRPAGDQDPRIEEDESYFAYAFRGGNPALEPESADIFTTGLDVRPAALPGLRLSVTYFDIEYSDMIFSIFPFQRLNDPAFANFVQPYPSRDFLQTLVDGASSVTNFLDFPIDLDSVQVFMESGLQNVSALRTSGFDINTRYSMPLGEGNLNFSLKASYVLKYVLRTTELAAPSNNVDRVGEPLRLTARASAGYARGPWTVNAALNFKDRYVDDFFGPVLPAPIDSSTTLDLGLTYEPAHWRDLRLAVNVRNVTNEEPPRVDDFFGFHFDTANGDPIGRVLSLELTKGWGR